MQIQLPSLVQIKLTAKVAIFAHFLINCIIVVRKTSQNYQSSFTKQLISGSYAFQFCTHMSILVIDGDGEIREEERIE